ncbi:MAG: DnaJ domain-containing protein [Desulfovibrionaceae bacterium]|nr:DnaJ domain-containing protein [Desulfovibrionaceae bacterium]
MPTHLTLQECYYILSVTSSAKLDEVKRAYHKKALELHPDHNPDDPTATEKFQKLNEAYTELSSYLRGEKAFVSQVKTDSNETDDWQEAWNSYKQRWHFDDSWFNDDDDDEDDEDEDYDEDEQEESYEEADREAYIIDDEQKARAMEDKILANPAHQKFAKYIQNIRNLYINESGEVLYQIRFKDIYEAKIRGNRKFGHLIIEMLVRKLVASNTSPSALWLNSILYIAGDPRESTRTESYKTWWNLLKPGYTNNVKRWLAEYDIERFFEIMKLIHEKKEIPDFENNYAIRETFIRGLFQHHFVREVRLFLGTSLMKDVQNAAGSVPAFITEVTGAGRFVAIYLNLRDKAHIIESTHNYSLRILSKIPKRSVLAPDYDRKKKIEKADLAKKLAQAYKAEFNDHLYYEKLHSTYWKYDLISIFDLLGLHVRYRDIR